ncbi:MAG TPA: GNAT family N-acetyltransferase [Cyclobacteriaceae bacterium]|nr:GNAT family N-acetyltransferase [Cyclobacteriaceae bacterium]
MTKTVAVIEMFPSDEATVGLYGLATRREFRGKGIGSAMMTYALNKAMTLGYENVILQASPDAIGIYKRYGFKVVTRYYEYA